MPLAQDTNRSALQAAGWQSRGYLPHFDGRAVPQFITLHLADAVPSSVINRWRTELDTYNSPHDRLLLRRRIEKYMDQGFGNAYLKDEGLARLVQQALWRGDGEKYRLAAWVIMPNHVHLLLTRLETLTLSQLMQSFKSLTAHQANKLLGRSGHFWMADYFDRYMRNPRHYEKTVEYIENNPVKARICSRPEEYRFSSAWFRKHG